MGSSKDTIRNNRLELNFSGDMNSPTTVPRQWALDMGQLTARANINRGTVDVQDPTRGLTIKLSEQILPGGPFYPSIYVPAVKLSAQADDQIVVGQAGVVASGITYNYKPGRSATTPGILMVSAAQKSLTTEELVPIFTAADTRMLTLKTVVSGSSITVTYPFYTLTQLTDGTTLKDWKDSSGNVHFPLGWITVAQETRAGVAKWRVQQITWPNTQWVLQGGVGATATAISTVQITGGSGYNLVCTVYGNGTEHTATETGVTLKSLNNITVLPTNQYVGAWRQIWHVGGVDTLLWTTDYWDVKQYSGYASGGSTQILMNSTGGSVAWVNIRTCP